MTKEPAAPPPATAATTSIQPSSSSRPGSAHRNLALVIADMVSRGQARGEAHFAHILQTMYAASLRAPPIATALSEMVAMMLTREQIDRIIAAGADVDIERDLAATLFAPGSANGGMGLVEDLEKMDLGGDSLLDSGRNQASTGGSGGRKKRNGRKRRKKNHEGEQTPSVPVKEKNGELEPAAAVEPTLRLASLDTEIEWCEALIARMGVILEDYGEGEDGDVD